MEWFWIILGIVLCIVAILGSLLPLLPGPPVAFIGLLLQQLRDPNPFETKTLLNVPNETSIVLAINIKIGSTTHLKISVLK